MTRLPPTAAIVFVAERIGIAGHSQGGFTALWVGGAKVNPDRYAAFQRR